MAPQFSENPPRILIVSRRTVRKNKFVDFVGEYHLDLLVGYGAVPIIVPRVAGIDKWLRSFEPIHGVLLCEGEDIDPSLYDADTSDLSLQEQEAIKKIHASDTSIDKEKDSIELNLTKLCVERNIPYLGICRGSQILNVVCGGTLYQDVGLELSKKLGEGGDRVATIHMDYQNYDDHRHVVKVVKDTPMHHWFNDSMDEKVMEISVNSYHHQGVKKLAQRFVPMAFAPDGLIEGFYDPNTYNPQQGKFTVGIQFHPERMRMNSTEEFDYPGCSSAYKDFVKAATAYKNKLESLAIVGKPIMLVKNNEMEKKRKIILRSFSFTRDYSSIGDAGLSSQQETRLIQMGATVRNSSSYFDSTIIKKVQLHEKELLAFNILRKMSLQQLSDLSTVLLPIYGTN